MAVGERVLSNLPGLASPLFWGMLNVVAAIAFATLTPVTYWLARSGQLGDRARRIEPSSAVQALPTLKRAWPQLAVSLVFMIVSLVITISFVAV
jgi:hypothetical protein